MYVAAKGGEQAIQNSEALYNALNGVLTLETVRAIHELLPYLVDRVMGEGSLYAPELAALALAQTGGDLYEAVLLLRAYRATQPRIAYAHPTSADKLFTVRRISAAFKDIPGGQVLGPSLDYSHRLLRLDVLDGQADELNREDTKDAENNQQYSASSAVQSVASSNALTSSYPALADWQRGQGLLPQTEP